MKKGISIGASLLAQTEQKEEEKKQGAEMLDLYELGANKGRKKDQKSNRIF